MSDQSQDMDEQGMSLALIEAGKAADLDEVPVGAVVFRGDEVVGRGHNLTRTNRDPTAHAEMVAIRAAAETLHTWWLEGCTLYVTLEPCSMCAGSIVLARLDRLVFGAVDPKAGACGSLRNIVEDPRLNHRIEMTGGRMQKPCGELLKSFFGAKRKK